MLKRWRKSRHRYGSAGDGPDLLASLVLAAKEDSLFRKRVLAVLRLPQVHREPLIRTAIEQMRLHGEPIAAQQAFALLATEDGAAAALRALATTDAPPL